MTIFINKPTAVLNALNFKLFYVNPLLFVNRIYDDAPF